MQCVCVRTRSRFIEKNKNEPNVNEIENVLQNRMEDCQSEHKNNKDKVKLKERIRLFSRRVCARFRFRRAGVHFHFIENFSDHHNSHT